jgi:(4-O-methyl)-D-glucuronate---lignin esterase
MKPRILLSYIAFVVLACNEGNSHKQQLDILKAGFETPPLEARPRALWAWVNGNFDREEITREMEEATRMGMGGFDIWDVSKVVDENNIVPAGPSFMSDEYVDAICYAINEAERLQLNLGLIIASGWNAGGAWTLPENQTMGLFHSEKTVNGPANRKIKLDFPLLPDEPGSSIYNQNSIIPRGNDGRPQFYREIGVIACRLVRDSILDTCRDIIDLSGRLTKGEEITWQVPEGNWKIVRYVCANTGQPMISSTPNSNGPMIDHFNPVAAELHIRYFIDKLEAKLGKPLGESGLSYFYTDSYEVVGQLWTPKMADEFKKRKGYSLIPFLPVFDGYKVVDAAITSRFLYDYRQVLSDLIIENHYAKIRGICEAHGVGFVAEAAGPGQPIHNCPFESLKSSGSLTFPRGEFWYLPSNTEFWRRMQGKEEERHYLDDLQVIKGVACASHIYNKKYVEAEAFTSTALWNEGPGDLKPTADRAFCEGLNRVIFHTWPHTPKAAGKPGWVYSFGTIMNENRIWWPMVRPWMDYLGRCSFMLQQGDFVGDILFYYGDSAPNFVPAKHRLPGLDYGYDYDVINSDVLLNNLFVSKGKLKLTHGQEYELLVLPDVEYMQPEILHKIKDLVLNGATIVGPKPLRSNGLNNWQERDKTVKELADKLWGNCDGKEKQEYRSGAGRIVWGKDLSAVLADRDVLPDFNFEGNIEKKEIDFIHRKIKDIDIYFIRNKSPKNVFGTGIFRQQKKQASYWNPLTGDTSACRIMARRPHQTLLPITLDPNGSIFIVFASGTQKGNISTIIRDGKVIFPLNETGDENMVSLERDEKGFFFSRKGEYAFKESLNKTKTISIKEDPSRFIINGPWQVYFPDSMKGPGKVTFDSLIWWTDSNMEGIRFFSGIATYSKEFVYPDSSVIKNKKLLLEFENIMETAHVYLNGIDLGICWIQPYRIDITGALRKGKNQLRVEVANTWANRLCGDARLPHEQRISNTNITRLPNAWSYPMDKIPNEEYDLLEGGMTGKVSIVMYEYLTFDNK